MRTKLLLILTIAIFALTFTSASTCQDSLNGYLVFTDHSEQNTLEVTQGDNVRLTSVAYSYAGPLWYEELEVVHKLNIFTKYEEGNYNGLFHLFTDTRTFDTSILEPGTYTLKFTASTLTDCSLESETLILTINPSEPPLIDDQCPIVDILYPENGATYNDLIKNTNFNVNENIKLESCSYTLNGQNFNIPNCVNGSNSINISTLKGPNTLTISATDNSSNTCSDTVSFNVELPEEDNECPEINIQYPEQNKIYSTFISTATYTLSDESEIDSCYYIVNDGQTSERYSCNEGINYLYNLDFIEGSNILEVFSKDEFDNECSNSVEFKIKTPEPPNDTCPDVNILSPIDGRIYSNWENNSIFTVQEDYQLDSCTYTLNGQTINIPDCNEGTNYLSDLNPLNGPNILRVSATDNASQTCYDEITFNINITNEDENETEDNQCPIVDITFPINSETYNELIENANFNVNENIQLDSCTYNLNGNSYEIENCINGSNTLQGLLTQEGPNTLTISATDNSSNTCSDSITFKIEFDDDEEENETCKDCCAEPDYYNYYYEENKTIKDYFWKNEDKVKEEEIKFNLEFNPKTAWERFIGWLERVFS